MSNIYILILLLVLFIYIINYLYINTVFPLFQTEDQMLKERVMRKDKIKAIQEIIAGFLNDQVIDPKGEHYYIHKVQLKPNIDEK